MELCVDKISSSAKFSKIAASIRRVIPVQLDDNFSHTEIRNRIVYTAITKISEFKLNYVVWSTANGGCHEASGIEVILVYKFLFKTKQEIF